MEMESRVARFWHESVLILELWDWEVSSIYLFNEGVGSVASFSVLAGDYFRLDEIFLFSLATFPAPR